jgi:hypothetical protein
MQGLKLNFNGQNPYNNFCIDDAELLPQFSIKDAKIRKIFANFTINSTKS